MQSTTFQRCVGALAYSAGLARGLVGLLVPLKAAAIVHPTGLRKRIVGHSKREVARLLGPPPAAGSVAMPLSSPTFWLANTWYYPFNPRKQTAVAVQFNQDRVVGVDFIGV